MKLRVYLRCEICTSTTMVDLEVGPGIDAVAVVPACPSCGGEKCLVVTGSAPLPDAPNHRF